MGIVSGTRLGPYEIQGPLGAGGMGEVYRARDTRLGREVAIKVLPEEFANERSLRERLDREARAVSKLSHPHICTLYDIGHQDGVDYLVLEYLEGETLEQRLERGPLPPEQVVRYGIQIADALARAHRAGIIHRDLKPGNVMLTKSGAKLMDFGLAKAQATVPAIAALSQMATADRKLTEEGTLLGTFQYMAPEQLEGQEADARTDIFALGVVLYEMATGRPAFTGKTRASLIASILSSEPPPIGTFHKLHPPALDRTVRQCIAKDPEERLQSAHDVKLNLLGVAEAQQGMMAPMARRTPWGALTTLLAIALLVVAVVLLMRREAPAPAAQMVRASLLPPPNHSFAPYDFAVSPDGTKLAFVATSADGVSTLWVSSLGSSTPAEISGTEGASWPFWSPDSRWIAFIGPGKLKKVQPGGGDIQVICDLASLGQGGDWNKDDVILFKTSVLGPILRVDASGGTPQEVTKILPEHGGEAHRHAVFLPDGRRFLYVSTWTTPERTGLYLGSLDGAEPKLLTHDIRDRIVLASGHLLFYRAGTLYAQPFDAEEGVLTGEAKAVIRQEIESDWRFGNLPIAASNSGVLVYRSRYAYKTALVWFDRKGQELGTLGLPGYGWPKLAGNEERLAVLYDGAGAGQPNLWMHDLRRNIGTQLNRQGFDTAHTWSPDGEQIAYSSQRPGSGIYLRRRYSSDEEEKLVEGKAHVLVNDWSPDGRYLFYMNFEKAVPEIWRYDFTSRSAEMFTSGAEAQVSPDGKWVAHLGFTGVGALHVASMTNPKMRIQISKGAAAQAQWRGDSKELFYMAPDKKLMAASINQNGDSLEVGEPRELFQTRIIESRLTLFQWAASEDGQRFLIHSLPREDAAAPLTLVVNWQEELKK